MPIAMDKNNLFALADFTSDKACGTTSGLTVIKTTSDCFTTGRFSTTASAPKSY